MPFGPYLAAAGLVILFFGETLMTEYLQRVTL
jgi:prepilin signal peptidase PulO-like enzyme (type II secretory pathway)